MKKEKIRNILEDFALTFAIKEDNGTYWGHDTNLGNCEGEFELAMEDMEKVLTQARQEERERIKEVFEREYKKRVEKEGEPIRWSRNEIFNIINH